MVLRVSGSVLTSMEAASLLRVDRRTVLRVPRERLPYSLTPGGGVRQHRRYLLVDVVAYGREFLEFDPGVTPTP